MSILGEGFILIGPLTLVSSIETQCPIVDLGGIELGKLHVQLEFVGTIGKRDDGDDKLTTETAIGDHREEDHMRTIKLHISTMTECIANSIDDIKIYLGKSSREGTPIVAKPKNNIVGEGSSVTFDFETTFNALAVSALQDMIMTFIINGVGNANVSMTSMAIQKPSKMCTVM